jgi:hypothetical protein
VDLDELKSEEHAAIILFKFLEEEDSKNTNTKKHEEEDKLANNLFVKQDIDVSMAAGVYKDNNGEYNLAIAFYSTIVKYENSDVKCREEICDNTESYVGRRQYEGFDVTPLENENLISYLKKLKKNLTGLNKEITSYDVKMMLLDLYNPDESIEIDVSEKEFDNEAKYTIYSKMPVWSGNSKFVSTVLHFSTEKYLISVFSVKQQ